MQLSAPLTQTPLLGMLRWRSRDPWCAKNHTMPYGLPCCLHWSSVQSQLPHLHVTSPRSSHLTGRSSFHAFSVLLNLKLPEEELKNPQLTWGQAVRSMAAITWCLSQRRAAAEEKQRKCEKSPSTRINTVLQR